MTDSPAPTALKIVSSVPASARQAGQITEAQYKAALVAVVSATGLTIDPTKVTQLSLIQGPNGQFGISLNVLS